MTSVEIYPVILKDNSFKAYYTQLTSLKTS